MTNPPDRTSPNISDVAAEPPEESVRKEQEAVEEEVDNGDAAPQGDPR